DGVPAAPHARAAALAPDELDAAGTVGGEAGCGERASRAPGALGGLDPHDARRGRRPVGAGDGLRAAGERTIARRAAVAHGEAVRLAIHQERGNHPGEAVNAVADAGIHQILAELVGRGASKVLTALEEVDVDGAVRLRRVPGPAGEALAGRDVVVALVARRRRASRRGLG